MPDPQRHAVVVMGWGMARDIPFPYASVYLSKARSWVHPWPHQPASCRAHVLLSGVAICCSPWIYHHQSTNCTWKIEESSAGPCLSDCQRPQLPYASVGESTCQTRRFRTPNPLVFPVQALPEHAFQFHRGWHRQGHWISSMETEILNKAQPEFLFQDLLELPLKYMLCY